MPAEFPRDNRGGPEQPSSTALSNSRGSERLSGKRYLAGGGIMLTATIAGAFLLEGVVGKVFYDMNPAEFFSSSLLGTATTINDRTLLPVALAVIVGSTGGMFLSIPLVQRVFKRNKFNL